MTKLERGVCRERDVCNTRHHNTALDKIILEPRTQAIAAVPH